MIIHKIRVLREQQRLHLLTHRPQSNHILTSDMTLSTWCLQSCSVWENRIAQCDFRLCFFVTQIRGDDASFRNHYPKCNGITNCFSLFTGCNGVPPLCIPLLRLHTHIHTHHFIFLFSVSHTDTFSEKKSTHPYEQTGTTDGEIWNGLFKKSPSWTCLKIPQTAPAHKPDSLRKT